MYCVYVSTKLDPKLGLLLMWELRRRAKQGFTKWRAKRGKSFFEGHLIIYL